MKQSTPFFVSTDLSCLRATENILLVELGNLVTSPLIFKTLLHVLYLYPIALYMCLAYLYFIQCACFCCYTNEKRFRVEHDRELDFLRDDDEADNDLRGCDCCLDECFCCS